VNILFIFTNAFFLLSAQLEKYDVVSPVIAEMKKLESEISTLRQKEPEILDRLTKQDVFSTLNEMRNAIETSKRWENFFQEMKDRKEIETKRLVTAYQATFKNVMSEIGFLKREAKRKAKKKAEEEEAAAVVFLEGHKTDFERRRTLKKQMKERRETEAEDWEEFAKRAKLPVTDLNSFLLLELEILSDENLDD
jgi:hypothetical protein